MQMTIKERIELFIGGLLLISFVYGLFYIGYEVFPDGWATPPFKFWWSAPTLMLMAGLVVLSVILGVTAIGLAIGLIGDDDDDQTDDESEGQTQL